MKSLQITLGLFFILFSTLFVSANNSDKIASMTRDVVVEPVKDGAVVVLNLYYKHPENIKEMTIERGTVLGEKLLDKLKPLLLLK